MTRCTTALRKVLDRGTITHDAKTLRSRLIHIFLVIRQATKTADLVIDTMSFKLGFTCDDLKDEFPVERAKIDLVQTRLVRDGLPTFTDEHVLLFLTSCNGDVDFAIKTIVSYVRTKRSDSAIFDDWRMEAEEVQAALQVGTACVCPRTNAGSAVVLYVLKNDDYWNWSLRSAAKLLFMAIECAIYDYPARDLEIHIDLHKIKFGHLLQIRPSAMTTVCEYLQTALPIKLRRIHVYNGSSLMDRLLAVIAPFMSAELLAKVTFHQKDVELPRNLPPLDNLEASTATKLKEIEDYFREHQRTLFV